MDIDRIEVLLEKVWQICTIYGLKVIGALAVLIIGRWIAKILRHVVRRMMEKGKVDQTLITFITNLTYVALMTFVVLAALNQLGIQTASFIAIIGAAGLAVGLALQGSLSNFAAGVLMIIFRPFKVGDIIEAAGVTGTVEEIQIFTTQLKTPDNKTIIIPNAKVTDDNIVNYSAKGTRRVDMVMGIGYGDDIDKARDIINDIIASEPRILETPAPQIAVSELADSSVNFVVRPWVRAEDYWGVMFDLNEVVKKRFDGAGINIPYPQRDVHIYEHKA
ncbi:mechanosensitive ion channel protein [Desulfonema ishimotonii]|uniref:Mechanosensitive ion channel protein n=1 Tax=Desulfonema ishimotonii TaxID=45657 RepID=A0A401G3U6_9BACT|nr:mechanosensitive ion channel domain-containing protein [Desulfonema ishimotonii]GBC63909.1 mechanosensitive ion channel protein [Desulfonema ishimotonii]